MVLALSNGIAAGQTSNNAKSGRNEGLAGMSLFHKNFWFIDAANGFIKKTW